MKLQELARLILSINSGPLNRIRFAKTIYFVHKELIRKGIMRSEDVAYIRSPLGPVPDGFLTLSLSPYIILRKTNAPLSFDAEEYLLNPEQPETSPPLSIQVQSRPIIQKTLNLLNAHSTASLVEASHDLSWQQHLNGERYYIIPTDLKNTFPFSQIRIKIRIKTKKPVNPTGALQANLLRGMIHDIVKESTDLEYPDTQDQPEQASQPRSNQSSSSPTPDNSSKQSSKPGQDA